MCVWGVDPTPNDPVLLAVKGGAVGGGRANIRTFSGGIPATMVLVGVDRLRCKWLNLNFASVRRTRQIPARLFN